MKTTRILISSLIICLLFTSFGGQVVQVQASQAPPWSSLYWTEADLADMYNRLSDPYFSTIFGQIEAWAEDHVDDALWAEVDISEDQNYEWRRWFETMVFMYHMTQDTVYADAVKNQLLNVANNWDRWETVGGSGRPAPAEFSIGVAQAWAGIKDYLSEAEQTIVINHVVAMVEMDRNDPAYPDNPKGQLYGRYTSPNGTNWRVPAVGDATSGTCAVIGGCATIGLAFLGDAPTNAQNWIDYAEENIDWLLDLMGTAGGMTPGPNYSMGAFEMVSTYWIASDKLDRDIPADDLIEGFADYLIYLTADRNPMQVEDTTGQNAGANPLWKRDATRLGFLWWIGTKFNNGYSLQHANLYGGGDVWEHFVYYDGIVEALEFSGLPLSRYFPVIEYNVWRSGFDNYALIFLTKFGFTFGHAHRNCGSFIIYNNRYGVCTTRGYGYADDGSEYQCLLRVDEANQQKGDDETGTTEEVAETDYYRYIRGDSSPVWSGMVDMNQRQIVMINGLNYFVVFDRVHSATERQYDYALSSTNRAPDAPVTIADNIITIKQSGSPVLENVIVYPHEEDFTSEWEDLGGGMEVIRVHPTVDVTTAHFLNMLFVPGHSDILPYTEVAQSNCSGVIVEATSDTRDLILFSNDGNPVSQYIELGGNYQAADGESYTFVGTTVLADFTTYQVMRLALSGTNQPPVLSPIGDKSISEGELLEFTISATDPNGDPLTYSASNLPSGASFDTGNRTFSWTPGSGQEGSYPNVHFEVTDGELTDTEDITITVSTVNNPPVLIAIGNKSVNEGELLEFTISATDPDGDPLTYSASNLPSGASFDSGNRTFSWTPSFTQAGSYSNVHFEVTDGGLTDAEDITITVSNVKDPPVLDTIGDKSINEGELLQFTISATDSDGDPLTYSASNLPSGASFDTGNSTFSWTPSFIQVGSYPGVHFEVTDGELTDTENITITVTYSGYVPPTISFVPPTDDDNATVNRDWTEVNVSVDSSDNDTSGFIDWGQSLVGYWDFNENTNDKSTYNNDGTLNGAQSTTGKYSNAIRFNSDGDYLLINDSASMDFEKSRGTIELWLYPFDKASGVYQRLVVDSSFWGPESPYAGIELAIQPSGNLYFYPAEGGGDNYNLVTDPLNDNEWQHLAVTWDYSTKEVLIYINGVNQSFAVENVPANWDTIAQTDDWYIGGANIDTGLGFFNGIIDEVRIWNRTLSEEEIRASYNANIYSLTHTFTNLSDGTYQYYAYAIDTIGNSAQTETRTLTVNTASPNDPPVLTAIGDKSVNEGELLQFTVSATDPDGDPLTYSASNLPSGASFDTGNRTFSWTPSFTQAGSYPNVHLEVTDGGLTDAEDITITVNNVNQASSGGGGGGGSVPPQDKAAPELSDVFVSEITTSSVDIVWTTDEESTSQVEYWASPSNFSPLDETLVTHHVVHLANLTSGTTYHYRVMSIDEANNLAVSDEYTFTTLVTPTAFAVSALDITPTEVDIGEEVTISVLVDNSGDTAGSYEVTLSVDGTTEDTKYIAHLAGGASLKVTFTTARNAAGTFVVDVNGITGSLIVKEVPVVEEIPNPEPEISLFSVTPSYDTETDKLVFTRVIYQVNNLYESMADAELTLKVSLDGEPFEEVPLLSSSQLEPVGTTGSRDYIPLQGWRSGTYTFQAELYGGGKFFESTVEERLEVAAESAVKVVRWATLDVIIGAMLVVILATILVVSYRRRHMLRA